MKYSIMSLLLIGLAATAAPQEQEPTKVAPPTVSPPTVSKERPMSFWMAKKLDYSKSMLEGLTAGDFEMIGTSARQMQLLGRIEEFLRRPAKGYAAQMHMFDMANSDLILQAERKNIEGATLAFNHLTSSCVACHTTIRENAAGDFGANAARKKGD